jgi:hypothetical protein
MVEFAVVGHPNKGKSSIVATLAENEGVAISAVPGTTREADRYTFSIDEEPLYTLVDTPGFQRARAVLDWLTEHATDASNRAEIVRSFVEQHSSDPRFHDECELLRPIVGGAGILYVVDGAKPYGAEFEIEMQILQWTGQPRMALINLIGEGRYLEQWQKALDQYFSIVRVFDAQHADFGARLNLLRAFAELNEDWRAAMERAVTALQQEREHRLQYCAQEIADALIDCLMFTEHRVVDAGEEAAAVVNRLRGDLEHRIRFREQGARSSVQAVYRHEHMAMQEASLQLLDMDLFTEKGWELFGLSKAQLLLTGTVTGAVAGLGIDALAGGATLLLGAGVGAVVGGITSWFGGGELAKTRVLGNALGGDTVYVGPIVAPNFPWVFLGRAWVHHHLVAERNHAVRDTVSTALSAQENLMDAVPDDVRNRLAKCLREVKDKGRSLELERRLQAAVAQLLRLRPVPEAGAVGT